MADRVDPRVIDDRAAELRSLGERLRIADAIRRIGTVEDVVMESRRSGTTGSYHTVLLAEEDFAVEPGSIVPVRLLEVLEDGRLRGRLLGMDE